MVAVEQIRPTGPFSIPQGLLPYKLTLLCVTLHLRFNKEDTPDRPALTPGG